MCSFFSGITAMADDRLTHYWSRKTDSHAEIMAEFNIRQDDHVGQDRMALWELIPIPSEDGLAYLDGYVFKCDGREPSWWAERLPEIEAAARRGLLTRIIKPGETIELIEGGTYLLLDGEATVKIVTGGDVWSHGTSSLTIETITGGNVWSYGTSSLTIKNDNRV